MIDLNKKIKKRLDEYLEFVILHCQNKVFFVNKDTYMYNENRILNRVIKLESRGWKKIDNNNKDFNRDLKIDNVFSFGG
jgi:hypothetical protein